MSTFSRATFDAAAYLAHRPRYSSEVVDVIIKYHASKPAARFSSAVDLGCGPGQLTIQLAKHFDHVKGFDPSEGMVKNGMPAPEGSKGKVEYAVGSAEDLKDVAEGSVDLVAAGQAAHWFNFDKTYKELLRVLRPGGSVALVGYAPLCLPQYPQANDLITEYNERRLSQYWEPGRRHVDLLYDTIAFPSSSQLSSSFGSYDPSSFKRIKLDLHPAFPPTPRDPSLPQEHEGTEHRDLIMTHRWKWTGLRAYLNTWSAVHTYDRKHGKEKGKTVADRFFDELVESLGVKQEEVDEKDVEVAWPVALLLMKKQT